MTALIEAFMVLDAVALLLVIGGLWWDREPKEPTTPPPGSAPARVSLDELMAVAEATREGPDADIAAWEAEYLAWCARHERGQHRRRAVGR